MTILMRVPMDKRNVLGRHLDEPCAGLNQSPREQATASKATVAILIERALFFVRQIESLLVLRIQKPMSRIKRAKHRLLLILARIPALRTVCNKLLVNLIAVLKSTRIHSLRRPNRHRSIFRKRQIERPKL